VCVCRLSSVGEGEGGGRLAEESVYLPGVREGSQLTKRELFLPQGGERFVERGRH
jgi:hypothetical protein